MMILKYKKQVVIGILFFSTLFGLQGCKSLQVESKEESRGVPTNFIGNNDTTNTADLKWMTFLKDPYLQALIDTALINNQELNILLQEIAILNNEVSARKGEYLPNVGIQVLSGVDKVGRYTSQGANDANTDIEPGKEMPEPLQDYMLGGFASWEIDIWHKLRNAKKSATARYLSSIEGRNFMVTHLISEIADSYYELLALDNQLVILNQNIAIQNNALSIVELQKQASKVTELAVQRFKAQVYHTQSLKFEIQQKITETENKLNFLVGRFPQKIEREEGRFLDLSPASISEGIPSQLLSNRPDIRQVELELAANKLDVKIARAEFYPSVRLSAGLGLQAFNPTYLVKTPESMIYSLAGDLVAPLINRKAIKAAYFSANAKQIQSVYKYEQTILNAYVEVMNNLAKMNNIQNSLDFKQQEVKALEESVTVSLKLFSSARADYMEVLMTQRDALEAKFELIETKKEQMIASINIYKALGGGWK